MVCTMGFEELTFLKKMCPVKGSQDGINAQFAKSFFIGMTSLDGMEYLKTNSETKKL